MYLAFMPGTKMNTYPLKNIAVRISFSIFFCLGNDVPLHLYQCVYVKSTEYTCT